MRQLTSGDADKGMLRVDPEPSSAATVRSTIRHALHAFGVSKPVIDDAVLVATELVGNALRHASALPSGDLEVCWEVDGERVTVQVTDGGGRQLPHMLTPDRDATTGRGLMIVDAVAEEWGVESLSDGGTTVWASLLRPTSVSDRQGPHNPQHH